MRIQSYPFGFLSLLNAKTTGQTPPDLLDELRGAVDVGPYFLASIALTTKTTSASGAAGAVGTTTTLTVPSNEAWQLVSLSAAATNGTAAQVLSYQLNIEGVEVAYQPPITITNAGQEFALAWPAPPGFIVAPGTRFNFRNALARANTIDQIVRAVYRPLQV